MKRFRFELQSLLDLRKQQKLQAELRQLQLRMELEGLQQQVRALQDELESVARQQVESFGSAAIRQTTISADRLMAMTQFSARLRDQIQEGNLKVQQAEITFRQAAAELAKISAAVEGLESLLESQRKEHSKQSDRRRQQDVDEVVIRQWQNREQVEVEEQSHV